MERTVFGHVADGVDAELPAELGRLAHQRVDLLLRVDGVAVEAGRWRYSRRLMAAVNAAVMPSSVTLQPLSFSISSPKPVDAG